MKRFITFILSLSSIAVFAQISIDGRKVMYDSDTNTMLATIPQTDFNSSKRYTIKLDDGWTSLRINGTTVTGSYYFSSIKGGKTYPITIKNPDKYVITSNITFTFLPIMQISGDFGYEYQEGTVSLYTPDGEVNDQLTARLKWRGGSTNAADKHKRNYKIKFDDDQQFFGLRSDDKWILDAGQADIFRVRNRIATELWNDMSARPYYADKEPDAHSGVRGRMVELFLNKEYRGVYCLTESMDRKEMKLKKVDKTTGAIRGCLYKSSGYGASLMYDYPSTYDNSVETWGTFEVKYPELDDAPETDWSTLWNAIDFVATSSDDDFRSHVAEYFDLPVVIDYYIFINVLNACDNVGKNMYWAVYDKTKDKRLTPCVWDLDLTAGSLMLNNYLPGTAGAHSPEYRMSPHTNLTYRLSALNVDGFNETVVRRYHELRKSVLSTDNMIARYSRYFDQIDLSGAGQREANRWSGDTDIKGEEIDFEHEIYYISYWLARHLSYLDEHQFKDTGSSTTDIRDHSADIRNHGADDAEAVYNLHGQRVKPSKKGLYVIGGRKYVVK